VAASNILIDMPGCIVSAITASFIYGRELPQASDARDHFDLRERVGHRRMLRPSGHCRCPERLTADIVELSCHLFARCDVTP
jgi:hypothetical protein